MFVHHLIRAKTFHKVTHTKYFWRTLWLTFGDLFISFVVSVLVERAALLRHSGRLESGRAVLESDTCTLKDVSLPALLSGKLSCCFMVRRRASNKAVQEVTGRKESLVAVEPHFFQCLGCWHVKKKPLGFVCEMICSVDPRCCNRRSFASFFFFLLLLSLQCVDGFGFVWVCWSRQWPLNECLFFFTGGWIPFSTDAVIQSWRRQWKDVTILWTPKDVMTGDFHFFHSGKWGKSSRFLGHDEERRWQ